MGDEEVHVVAAMLRNNVTIEELQFRRNIIGDDGARAIAAVLAERSALKLVDLRENHISMIGVKSIADALERSERIHKVMVHPGGKIEAFGASESIGDSESNAFAVKTVCIVDVRENQPKSRESGKGPQRPNNSKQKQCVSQSPSVKQSPSMKKRTNRASSADDIRQKHLHTSNRHSSSAPTVKMKRGSKTPKR